MAAPAMKTLRVSLVDLSIVAAGPGKTVSGEVWARLSKQVRTVDGQVVVLAGARKALDGTGIVDFSVPANDDTGIHADDRGFGVVIGWDLSGRGANGSTVKVYNTGSTVLVTTASPAVVAFSSLAPAVVTDPLVSYPTEAGVDVKIAAERVTERALQSSTFVGAVIVVGTGIDPTGVADSTAAIQAKIASLPAGGGVIYVPAGTFKITTKLTIGNDVTIIGAGKNVSRFKGALATALLGSPNSATRYYRWTLRDIGFDNTNRATAGGVGIDATNISLSRFDNVDLVNVATGMVLTEAAYYNEFTSVQVNGAVRALDIGGGAVSTNECLFTNLRINDVVDGVRINNSTNITFVKPAVELFTGIGFDVAPTSTVQYLNLFAPRLENGGAVGVGIHNRALAQATTLVGGMFAGLATNYTNDAGASNLAFIQAGQINPQTRTDHLMLTDSGGSNRAKLYANSSTYYFRNNADSGYMNTDQNSATIRGSMEHVGASAGFFGTAPQTKETGVAVTAAAIHAALVRLGIFAA